jgi:Flavodoxin domain
MRTVVIYESMYGNTRTIAEALARGIGGEVEVQRAGALPDDVMSGADLVVVGAPTHVRGLPGRRSRLGAKSKAAERNLEPFDVERGVREWVDGLDAGPKPPAAAFDTRADGPAFLTGRASRRIARRLRRKGFAVVADPQSFLVAKGDQLVAGEAERAEAWGRSLAATRTPLGR